MKKNDFIIIALGLLIASAVFGGLQLNNSRLNHGEKMVEVYLEGELIEQMPLGTDTQRRYEAVNGYNVIQISQGSAKIIEADCPTLSCIDDGSIDGVNETVVCLPHHFHIRITGTEEVEIDAISE